MRTHMLRILYRTQSPIMKIYHLLTVTALSACLFHFVQASNLDHSKWSRVDLNPFQVRPLSANKSYERKNVNRNDNYKDDLQEAQKTTKQNRKEMTEFPVPKASSSAVSVEAPEDQTQSLSIRRERGIYDGNDGHFEYGVYGEDDLNKHLGHKNHEEYGHKLYGGHKNRGESNKGGYDYDSEYGKKHGYSKGYSKGFEHKYDHQYGQDFGHNRHHGHKNNNYHDYGLENQKYGKGLHHLHAGYGNQGHTLHHGHLGQNYYPLGHQQHFHGGLHGLFGLNGGIFGGLGGLGRLHRSLGSRRPFGVPYIGHGLGYGGGSFPPGGYLPFRYY